MPSHKFKAGDIVAISGRFAPGGVFEVTRELPGHNGEREYRIKSSNEPHERLRAKASLSGLRETLWQNAGRVQPLRVGSPFGITRLS